MIPTDLWLFWRCSHASMNEKFCTHVKQTLSYRLQSTEVWYLVTWRHKPHSKANTPGAGNMSGGGGRVGATPAEPVLVIPPQKPDRRSMATAGVIGRGAERLQRMLALAERRIPRLCHFLISGRFVQRRPVMLTPGGRRAGYSPPPPPPPRRPARWCPSDECVRRTLLRQPASVVWW